MIWIGIALMIGLACISYLNFVDANTLYRASTRLHRECQDSLRDSLKLRDESVRINENAMNSLDRAAELNRISRTYMEATRE
jgi:hypothetical protein